MSRSKQDKKEREKICPPRTTVGVLYFSKQKQKICGLSILKSQFTNKIYSQQKLVGIQVENPHLKKQIQ